MENFVHHMLLDVYRLFRKTGRKKDITKFQKAKLFFCVCVIQVYIGIIFGIVFHYKILQGYYKILTSPLCYTVSLCCLLHIFSSPCQLHLIWARYCPYNSWTNMDTRSFTQIHALFKSPSFSLMSFFSVPGTPSQLPCDIQFACLFGLLWVVVVSDCLHLWWPWHSWFWRAFSRTPLRLGLCDVLLGAGLELRVWGRKVTETRSSSPRIMSSVQLAVWLITTDLDLGHLLVVCPPASPPSGVSFSPLARKSRDPAQPSEVRSYTPSPYVLGIYINYQDFFCMEILRVFFHSISFIFSLEGHCFGFSWWLSGK